MTSKKWLSEEVEAWQKDNIISDSQAKQILSRYPENKSKVMAVVSTIGALLVGLGILVFVASNWQQIPAFLKLIILFGSTFGFFVAGWKTLESYPILGHSLAFLGSIMVGVTLALTGQIFHLEANYITFFLLWFVAVAPLSYGFKSKPNLVLSLFLLGFWLAALMGKGGDIENLIEGLILGSGVWLFYGLALYGTGQLHSRTPFSFFKNTFQGFGIFYTLFISYVFIVSELEFLDELGQHWMGYLFLVLALASVFLAFLRHEEINKYEFVWLILAIVTSLIPWLLLYLSPNFSNDVFLLILVCMHIVYAGLVLVTLFYGYFSAITTYVNFGVFFFVLYIGYFYFTTVFTYLPKSLALVMGGIILLVGGWYLEKQRRKLIKDIGERHED